jgi:hypothetical protein
VRSSLSFPRSSNLLLLAPRVPAAQAQTSAALPIGAGRLVEAVVMLLLFLGLAIASSAAESKPRPPQNSNLKPSPPAVPGPAFSAPEPVLVKSVFVVPTKPGEGKDPFFPKSTRLFPDISPKTVAAPARTARVELHLKGISGMPGHRLAIINNRTIAAGEETDVSTVKGPVRIHCLDINADSALVQIGDEKRELRLRPGI